MPPSAHQQEDKENEEEYQGKGRDDREERDDHRDHIFEKADQPVAHAEGTRRNEWASRRFGRVHAERDNEPQDNRDRRVQIADNVRVRREQDRSGGWADERLDDVIQMIESRNLVHKELDEFQRHQRRDDPFVGEHVEGRAQLDPRSKARGKPDDQQRDVCIQPRRGREAESCKDL